VAWDGNPRAARKISQRRCSETPFPELPIEDLLADGNENCCDFKKLTAKRMKPSLRNIWLVLFSDTRQILFVRKRFSLVIFFDNVLEDL
jgi:hypothetical protein